MPHATAPSTDTLPSFTSDDLEASSSTTTIAVAQTARGQKQPYSAAVLTLGSTSMNGSTPQQQQHAVFSFEEQPLPTLSATDSGFVGNDSARGSNNATPSMASSDATAVPYQPLQSQLSVKRTDYEEQFAYKDHPSSAREKVTRDAPVIAELRTNVIINDEYTLTTHLSYHLSTRYQRPESSVAVTIQHSACLCLGGSFQPAYILTVSALPSLIQPATNKRNAALIQSFMSDVLSVSPDRGIIRFSPIEEQNIATNGRTILAEIEKLEKQQADESKSALARAVTKGGRRRSLVLKEKKSQELARSNTSKTAAATASPGRDNGANGLPPAPSPLPLNPRTDSLPARTSPYPEPEPFDSGSGLLINSLGNVVDSVGVPEASPVDSKLGRAETKVDRRPSSRGSTKHKQLPMLPKDMPSIPPPPPIPMDDDAKSRKVGKRKSIISIFRSRS